ncbi:MAG: hypothetical protein SOY43_11440 [Parabacteroides sp.]|nr:hypothetical protein [bacterium]MDY4103468.1 hypothetical protein [Parabacteroides sp.]
MKTIQDILIERGYPEKQAISVTSDLQAIDPTLKDGLQSWLTDQTETEYLIEGVKLSELKQKFDMTYPAALLTMDWLIKEPELAKKSIQRGIR